MGNALVDILAQMECDTLLEELKLPKGSMQLVEEVFIETVMEAISKLRREQVSGGSAANTIYGLARLGVKTGFVGKVCNDEIGDFFLEDLKKSNIEPKLFRGVSRSGVACALISPDSERTFATHLGAAMELAASDLSADVFKDYDYLHIEGYLVQNHGLIERAVSLAKEEGLKVSLDLASYNIVEENLEFLKGLVRGYVDIVFANEEEAKAFTKRNPREALDILAEDCDIAVIKIGKKGSLIKQGNNVFEVGVIDVNSVDTTGAGDLYASGFLYGLVRGRPLDECGKMGAIISGKVIEVIGAKMDDLKWKEIKRMMEEV